MRTEYTSNDDISLTPAEPVKNARGSLGDDDHVSVYVGTDVSKKPPPEITGTLVNSRVAGTIDDRNPEATVKKVREGLKGLPALSSKDDTAETHRVVPQLTAYVNIPTNNPIETSPDARE